jgi:hypothetical protein
MNIAAFLVAMVGPLTARILAALGLSLVSLSGVIATVAVLESTLLSGVSSLPLDGLQLAGLFGIWEALSMVLASWTFVITWHSTTGWWRLAKA